MSNILELQELNDLQDLNLLEVNELGDSDSLRISNQNLKVVPPNAFNIRTFVYVREIRFIKGVKTIKVEDPESGKCSGWFRIDLFDNC